jgi:hypothetical protein
MNINLHRIYRGTRSLDSDRSPEASLKSAPLSIRLCFRDSEIPKLLPNPHY